jgi:hypothetical protein
MRVKQIAHMDYKKMMFVSRGIVLSHVDMANMHLVFIYGQLMRIRYSRLHGNYCGDRLEWEI